MIIYKTGNIFDSTMQTMVIPVNTVGIMGAGLAFQAKKMYPEMYWEYRKACKSYELVIGHLFVYGVSGARKILCFPTKRHWKNLSRLKDIEKGLECFGRIYQDAGITSIAFPKIGCGFGGLYYEENVKILMEKYLGKLPIPIEIYE